MSSKKEEEKNEKIIRGLMKLPPNRRCINCNSGGPQYVCTNFWTFVCLSCSGIHREFTHRVKSVSMAKFTKQEVEALQQGGNQRAREIYLKNWDMTRMRLPDGSNPDKIRDFIRSVYVNKKYAGERSSEKPSGDAESLKANQSELTRPSSYHSFSQSPPYDYQYEERRYGKNSAMAPRRLASDRGYEGKVPSFLFSPGRVREYSMYEDRFGNESSGSRLSDFSVSSAGDHFRYDAQSPNSQEVGYHSPNVPYQSNRHPNSGPQRTASSGSFGSFDSNSLPEITPEQQPVQLTSGSQQLVTSPPSQLPPLSSNQVGIRPALVRPNASFNERSGQQPAACAPTDTSVDLFAGFNEQNKTGLNRTVSDGATVAFNKPTEVGPTSTSIDLFAGFNNQPPVEVKNEGWANFDFCQQEQVAVPNTSVRSSPVVTSTGHDLARGIQPVIVQVPVSSANYPSQVAQRVAKAPPVNQENVQPWNAFGESSGGGINATNTQMQMPFPQPSMPGLTQVAPGPTAQFSSLAPVGTNEVAKLSSSQAVQVQLPVQNPMASVPAQPQATDQWFASAHDVNMSPYQGIAQDFVKSDIHSVTALNSLTGPSSLAGEIPASLQPLQGMPYQAMKSTNPFDFPDDSDLPNNTFMDMSSIQAALPAQQAAADYYSSGAFVSQFYTQNPAPTYTAPMPQGGIQHMREQAPNPQILNSSPQGYPSLSSNPFA